MSTVLTFAAGRPRLGLRGLLVGVFCLAVALLAPPAGAQTVYGVGSSGGNRLFSVNPATGAATNLCALSAASTANGVSPVDGLVYYLEGGAGANPDLRKIDPITCTDTLVGASNLVGTQIRMTFCPDGRLYAASNTGNDDDNAASVYIWEINPASGQRVRRITLTNVRVEGSGDFTCVDNGDLYVLANRTRGNDEYRLYRVLRAALQGAANNGAVTATGIGTDLNLAGTPNGLTEVSTAVTGCNTNIAAYPCLIASTTTINRTWGINTQSGAATSIGATGFALTDLARSFPVNIAVTKTRSSPATVQQGNNITITYVITVANTGPGLAATATVSDTLDPAIFNVAAASWTCSVSNAGSATAVTTACGAASGSGNISQTVSLSSNATLTYNLAAPVLNTFNGTATNVAALALLPNITDPVPGNNSSTSPVTTVTAATRLTITKSNGANSVQAGGTTSYVLTVANTGLADADNAALRDPEVDGLACTQVVCSSATGNGATCPPAGTVNIANLQNMAPGGGILLPNFPSASTLTFTLTCGVDATGS